MATCRACAAPLKHVFLDLGSSPLSNSFLREEDLNKMEPFYPLRPYVCDSCLLVQLEAFETPEHIFREYAYFSSYSDSWLEHCRNYALNVRSRFTLGTNSLVIEVASNDGYLLQFFRDAEVCVLGIEPAANVARAAEKRGIPTISEFLGRETASRIAESRGRADLLIANNVLAHVPDLNDFIAGLAVLLKPNGVLTIEFPHLKHLIAECQFDTIYHEHFSYFSLFAAAAALRRHGLDVFDVDEVPTHGGSLRLYVAHTETAQHLMTNRPARLSDQEAAAGLHDLAGYLSFESSVQAAKRSFLRMLIDLRDKGHSVVAYGAPAKGNTLLNYCGIRRDLIDYTVDRNPYKQGRYLPGSHIPVFSPVRIDETKPDYVVVLPWNIRDEIMAQLNQIRAWGGRFITPIPNAQIVS